MTVSAANQQAVAAMQTARPVLVNIRAARDVIPELHERALLHAGPPVSWEHMVDVQRGAVIGALLYEGWASTAEQAAHKMTAREVRLLPCNDVDAVGGLAGVTSPSMPVAVVENAAGNEVAYCRLWEPRLIFGNHDANTIQLLKWVEHVLAPTLDKALCRAGPIDLSSIVAKALHMGDDCHSRLFAGSSIFLRTLLPHLVRAEVPGNDLSETIDFLAANDGGFLTYVMGSAKVIALAGSGVTGSSIVTNICSNGCETGIFLSGTGKRWFTGPAPVIVGNLLPGLTPADASPQIGDSAIAEVVGLGGCALAAAPEAPSNVSGKLQDALSFSRTAIQLAVTQHPTWTIPALEFAGTALGLDARQIVAQKTLPPLAATIPNRRAGAGRAGAGISHFPISIFEQALAALG